MSETPEADGYESTLDPSWRTLALAGVVVGLIGLMAVVFPIVTGLSITLGVGLLLVLGGVVHGAHAITTSGWRGRVWQLALGVVGVVAGLLVLANPVVGLLSLTILLVAYLVVDGIAELTASRRLEDATGRTAVAASGLISLVLAGLLFVGFPADAAWAIGLLVGVSLFVTGLSMVAVAYGARPVGEPAGEAEPRRA